MVYFVATPIGNLKDLSYRAEEALRRADIIFCEDTRHTLALLNAYEIKKPLRSCHKFNETEAAAEIVSAAREGDVAVVSDAGMPCISDPGNIVVETLQKEGVSYTVIPGPNAALSALVLSGFSSRVFAFLGFLPDKKGERERFLKKYASFDGTLIFHVAPQDIDKTIADMAEIFGDRRACIAREITKIHEEVVYFSLSEGYEGERRGEFVLLVEGAKEERNPLCDLSEKEHIAHYMAEGMTKSEAVKAAARDRGVKKSELYKFGLDL